MTISQIVTISAVRRAARIYHYLIEDEPVATDFEAYRTTNLQSLVVCIAQQPWMFEITVKLNIPGWGLWKYSVPKTCNEF